MSGNSDGRYAVFIEARQDGKRAQWFLFPPATVEQGAPAARAGRQRFIKRRLEHPGHRAKWATTEKPSASLLSHKLALELDQYQSTGWEFVAPIVIELEHDDYLKAWEGDKVSTPYKALRHVSKWAQKRGYDV